MVGAAAKAAGNVNKRYTEAAFMDCLLALGPFIKIGHFIFFAYLNNNCICNLMLCFTLARLLPSMFSQIKHVPIDDLSFGII